MTAGLSPQLPSLAGQPRLGPFATRLLRCVHTAESLLSGASAASPLQITLVFLPDLRMVLVWVF